MKDLNTLVFITGNQHKADYLKKWLGLPIEHQKVELEEIQSLDLNEVVEHKVRAAYEIVQRPVLVEDVALTFHGLGRLPGTFIKWFLEEIGPEGLCQLARSLDDKSATASILYGLFDGQELRTFGAAVEGTIAPEARVSDQSAWTSTKSWNSIFIPDGHSKTYGQMSDAELEPISHRAKAIATLREFLVSYSSKQ